MTGPLPLIHRLISFDLMRDRDSDFFALHHNFAARDRDVIGQNPNFFILVGIQLNHRSPAHFQELVNWHACPAQHDRQFNIDLTD